MSYDFHKDKATYITYQQENAERFVIPFIEKTLSINNKTSVMEIGCAEGGVLNAFLEKGCKGVGVELMESRYKRAQIVLEKHLSSGQARLINKNIYDVDIDKEFPEKFDLIVLKDVIEHIHDQDKVMNKLRDFLKPGGHIFFGFPPWYMPFGGHQQIASSKFLSKLPYYHVLPTFIYKSILKLFGESDRTFAELIEIKETGISIEKFHQIVRSNQYRIRDEIYYLINPIYLYKFNLRPRVLWPIFSKLKWLRNIYTTCLYVLIQKET